MLRECSPPFTCHLSPVTCHVSHVTCHVSHVMYLVTHVTCIFCVKQSGEARSNRWSVCYQGRMTSLAFSHNQNNTLKIIVKQI